MGRAKQFDPEVAVATAIELFWQQGYGATTPAELAAAMGIGKGSLYNAFDDKRALFERALRRYGDRRVARLTAALDRPGAVRERLQAALERFAAPGRGGERRRGCLAVNSATEVGAVDERVAAIVRVTFARMERALAKTIAEGQRSGELDGARDPTELASLILTTMLGMAVVAKAGAGPEQLHRVVRAVMATVPPSKEAS